MKKLLLTAGLIGVLAGSALAQEEEKQALRFYGATDGDTRGYGGVTTKVVDVFNIADLWMGGEYLKQADRNDAHLVARLGKDIDLAGFTFRPYVGGGANPIGDDYGFANVTAGVNLDRDLFWGIGLGLDAGYRQYIDSEIDSDLSFGGAFILRR